jgi:hypothetical protein
LPDRAFDAFIRRATACRHDHRARRSRRGDRLYPSRAPARRSLTTLNCPSCRACTVLDEHDQNAPICPSADSDRGRPDRPERCLFVSSGLCGLFLACELPLFCWSAGRRRVVTGPGVAWPKSWRSGCEPAALATESFPGCPPGPQVPAAAAQRHRPSGACR